jgi:dolichyl-phosphate beta-glucosyltransferase
LSQPKLSIVIPALREAGLIEANLRQVAEYLGQNDLAQTTEVLVVCAEGGDNTAELAKSCAKYFNNLIVLLPGPKVGKGRDVKYGMTRAKGELVMFMDADLATPLKYIKQATTLLESFDVVVGIRDLTHMHNSLSRKLTSQLSNLLISSVVVRGFSDTQCGFKVFRASANAKIFDNLRSTGWGFDMEVLALTKRYKYKIAQLPIPDWSDPRDAMGGLGGQSKLKVLLKTLLELFAIRLRLWRDRS